MQFNVYRVLSEGKPIGFSLQKIQHEAGRTFIPIEEVSEQENGVSVHLFNTEFEADAFCSGLESSGEDPVLSAVGKNELGCWAVIREIVNPCWLKKVNRPMSLLTRPNLIQRQRIAITGKRVKKSWVEMIA